MGQLAIKGHATRGGEVIALLGKMLDGKNVFLRDGTHTELYYSIDSEGIIRCVCNAHNGITLEEFEEKFPYKVGDNVMIDQCACTILSCWWDESVDEVAYCVKGVKGVNSQVTTYVKDLQPYKEQETMEKKDEKSANHVFNTEIISFDIAQRDKYELDLQGKFEVVLREGKYYVERIKPKYPKTFIEVLNFWHPDRQIEDDYQRYHKKYLIEKFQNLLYARDSYWKIAGGEMGLGKPWEPDWNNVCDKYTIYTVYGNEIWRDTGQTINTLLAFPTKEMRDAFYENFKDLIEDVKELL